MKTFKGYIITEASTAAAKDMEEVIVSAAGGPKFVSKHIPNSDEVGKRIVDTLKMSGDGGYMPNSTYPASTEWAEYFKPGKPKGSTLTPKTDIVVGKRKISVKTGAAVLMSGGTNEATATFYTAMNNAGNITDSVTNLKNHIDNLLPSTNMNKYDIKGNKTDLVKAGKFASIDILKRADEAHHKFKKDLREVFINTPTFAREFTFEAMTGKVKFGGNEGTATHFLVVDFDGSASYHKVTKSSDDYVGTILSQVNPSVKFKSTAVKRKIDGIDTKTGHYRFWSTVGLMYNAAIKTQNEVYDMMNSGELEYLSEGFFDFISRAWNKFKSFVKNLIEKVKNWIKKSVNNMMEYFQLQPNVRFRNQVRW